MAEHVHDWHETTIPGDKDRTYVCSGCLDERYDSRTTGRSVIICPTGDRVVTGL